MLGHARPRPAGASGSAGLPSCHRVGPVPQAGPNLAYVPPWPEVRETILATITAAIEHSGRSDVAFTLSPAVEPPPGTEFTWWIDVRAGDADYVAADESGYFENNLDGDKLTEFIRHLR